MVPILPAAEVVVGRLGETGRDHDRICRSPSQHSETIDISALALYPLSDLRRGHRLHQTVHYPVVRFRRQIKLVEAATRVGLGCSTSPDCWSSVLISRI